MERREGSSKARGFTESVIRDMTRLCIHYGGVNLAQGMPDFPAPERIKEAAVEAIRADINQYAITWGAAGFRQAISQKVSSYHGIHYDPDMEITVTCGSTEAMIASLMAVVDPGEEVVIFEPFYENFGPDTILCGAIPRYVTLYPPDWHYDPAELSAAFNERTRALVLNTPHNPTGKVFSAEELSHLAGVCRRWNTVVITDEIYEHILFDGARHISIANMPGMKERSMVISGLSKTYSVTGWRIGYILAPEDLTGVVRKIHDFLTVGAAAPLQEAGVSAMNMEEDYYQWLATMYLNKRDLLLEGLKSAGFRTFRPSGAYYIMTEIDDFGLDNDVAFCEYLVKEIGVAAVPGSSFYSAPELGRRQVRFCFCKQDETLREAIRRLQALHCKSR
jgi:aspartate/methionine/tyrosine aminotransferase